MVEQLSSSSEIPVHIHVKWSNVSRLHPYVMIVICAVKKLEKQYSRCNWNESYYGIHSRQLLHPVSCTVLVQP